MWQRFQRLDRCGTFGCRRMPKIPVLLQAEPEVGAHAGDPCQTKCHIRRDSPLASDDSIEPSIGDVDASGKRRLRHPERLQELFKQHFSRMSGRLKSWQAPSDCAWPCASPCRQVSGNLRLRVTRTIGCSCSLPRPFKPLSHVEALTRYYESLVFAVPVIDESRVHEITDGSFPGSPGNRRSATAAPSPDAVGECCRAVSHVDRRCR